MKCKFCREELPEGAAACPHCGAAVEREDSQENNPEQETNSGRENPYQYGAPNPGQENPYQYGAPNPGQENPYQYGAPNPGQENPYQYGAPNPGQENGNYGQPQKPINSTPYMVFAIISTILCCLPLGVAAIVFASKINTLQRVGDYEGARNAAKKSKIFMIIGAILTLILTIIYIVIAVVSFKATDSEAPLAPVGETLDLDDADDAEDKTADQKEEPKKAPVAVSGELGDTWETYTVQINDKVLAFPCEITELEAAGLVLDKEQTPENYIVNAGESELAYFIDETGNSVLVDLVNTTEEPVNAVDCLASGISVDDYGLEKGGLTVVFPGGIQMGMTKDEILEIYGDADDVYEGDSIHMYTWNTDDYDGWCEIDLDADTGLVTYMSMNKY